MAGTKLFIHTLNAEPSLQAKENATALKDADPEVKDAYLGDGSKGEGTDASADYKPSKDTDEGKDLDEGVELEPVDDEVV